MFTHLEDESYYNDRYDLATIERCLGFVPTYEKFLNFFSNFIDKINAMYKAT